MTLDLAALRARPATIPRAVSIPNMVVLLSPSERDALVAIAEAAWRLVDEGFSNPEFPHPGLLEDELINTLRSAGLLP